MFNPQGEDVMDMFIIKAVNDVSSIFSKPHQAPCPKQFQLLAYGTLLHTQLFTDGVYPTLPSFQEKKDLQAGRISKNFEEISNIDNFFFQRHHYVLHQGPPVPQSIQGAKKKEKPERICSKPREEEPVDIIVAI